MRMLSMDVLCLLKMILANCLLIQLIMSMDIKIIMNIVLLWFKIGSSIKKLEKLENDLNEKSLSL